MFERFTYHRDSGHGWLEVTTAQAIEVGLTLSAFSQYSYLDDGGVLYLEEDMDMMTFCRAFERKHGYLPPLAVVEYPGDAPIRRFNHLQPMATAVA